MSTITSELVNLISFKVKNNTAVQAISTTARIKSSMNELQKSLNSGTVSRNSIEKRLEATKENIKRLDNQLASAKGNFKELNNSLNIQLRLFDRYTLELKQADAANKRFTSSLERKKLALQKVGSIVSNVTNKYEKLNSTLHKIDQVSRSIQYKIGAPLAALDVLAIKTTMDFETLGIAFKEAFKGSDMEKVNKDMQGLSKDTGIDPKKAMEMMINLKNSGYTESGAIEEIKRQRTIQIATDPTGNVEDAVSRMAGIKRKGFVDAGDISQFGPEVEAKMRKHYGIPIMMDLQESLSKFGGSDLQNTLEKILNESAASHSGAMENYKNSLPKGFVDMMNSFTNFLNALGESFAGKGLVKVFNLITKVLDWLSKPAVMDVLSGIIAVVTVLASSGAFSIIGKIVAFLPGILGFLGMSFKVGSLVAGLVTPMGYIITALTLLPLAFKGLEWLNNLIHSDPKDNVQKVTVEEFNNSPALKGFKQVTNHNHVNVTVHANSNVTDEHIKKMQKAVTQGVNDSFDRTHSFYTLPGIALE
jgi:hypothetical protein